MKPTACLILLTWALLGQVGPRTLVRNHAIGETLEAWHAIEPPETQTVARDIQLTLRAEALRTDISPHHLGETVADWLRFMKTDCTQRKPSPTCKAERFVQIQKTGDGEIFTTDQYNRSFGWRFTNSSLVAYSTNKGVTWLNSMPDNAPPKDVEIITQAASRMYTWHFFRERLTEVDVLPDWLTLTKGGLVRPQDVPTFPTELQLLTQRYGPPADLGKVQIQNAMGAHWTRHTATWVTVDGIMITAAEATKFDEEGQLGAVSFKSKTATPDQLPQGPNPY